MTEKIECSMVNRMYYYTATISAVSLCTVVEDPPHKYDESPMRTI